MKNRKRPYAPPESRVMTVRLENDICVGSQPVTTDPQGADIQAQDVDAHFASENNYVTDGGTNWDASGTTN